MYLTFGYQREIPVVMKKRARKAALVGLALLIILLSILISFENLENDVSNPSSTFDGSPSLDKPNEAIQKEKIEFQKDRIFPEENEDQMFVSNQGGLK